jgi:dUTP pyrophosphatase
MKVICECTSCYNYSKSDDGCILEEIALDCDGGCMQCDLPEEAFDYSQLPRTTMKIKLDDGAYLPERAHSTDAGYDLRTPRRVVLHPHSSVTIDTGVHVQIPEGYVGFLKAKSGLNVKHNITGTGVIDSGYTGSIRVKLYNNGDIPHVFEVGDKLIQLVILPILTPELELVDELEDTERGSDGFGSTGR